MSPRAPAPAGVRRPGQVRGLLVKPDEHDLDLGEAHGDLGAAGQLPDPDRVLLLVPAELPEGLEKAVPSRWTCWTFSRPWNWISYVNI